MSQPRSDASPYSESFHTFYRRAFLAIALLAVVCGFVAGWMFPSSPSAAIMLVGGPATLALTLFVAGRPTKSTREEDVSRELDPARADIAIRKLIAHVDYDIFKDYESDEETGEDTFPELVDQFLEMYEATASTPE